MREIKYRAWDIEKEKMLDWEIILNDVVGNHTDPFNDERFVLMSFTGLNSKSSKEIYEGDVIRHNRNTFYIKFSRNQHCLLLKDVRKNSDSWRPLSWLSNVIPYASLIGNIHENPELLEAK